MKIIKDKQIIDDSWSHIADDNAITPGNITLSLMRWKNDKTTFTHHLGKIGVRLAPSDLIEEIVDDLKNIHLIGLEFPVFTDGRLFSHARLLRNRYHFQGEIRAMGQYMPDQVFYLYRVGVNAFQAENIAELQLSLATLHDFSVQYQTSTN